MSTHHYSRRDLIKLAAAAATGGVVSANANDNVGIDARKLTLAGYPYDRLRGLIDGRVKIDGFDHVYEKDKIGNLNTHVFAGPQTRQVTEIGLHPFMLAYANEGFRDYTLLPIFPLRVFRHKSIFIRNDRGIEKPEDLKGKRVATAGYSSTSLTWIRGVLEHEYGVKPSDVKWVITSKDSSAGVSGGPSKQENVLPDGLCISNGPEGKDESDLLAEGDVDAVLHAAEPRCFIEGHPKVGRLFSNSRQTERDYYKKTGIFPIMHAVAVHKKAIAAAPELPLAVFNAYSRAKQLAYDHFQGLAWAFDSLPWIRQEFESTRELMGDNYWPYGIEPNRKSLEALFQYSHEQGLANKQLTIDELFLPESLKFTEALG